ncbi:hypothetical protein QE152_g15421 [Popillia japonica]|uniref:Uncharacterized protein n=1 Tax=Popillia japonica TaxID=7064 RepID=A0AAW1L5R4_POPJA
MKAMFVIQIVFALLVATSLSAELPGTHSVASASAKADPYAYASHSAPVAATVAKGVSSLPEVPPLVA